MNNHKKREQEIKSCSLSLCKCLKITLGVLYVFWSDFRSGYEGFCTFFSKFRKKFFVVNCGKYRNPVGFRPFLLNLTYAKRPVSLSTYRSENQDEADGIRTRDNLIKSQVLYRLSYSLAKQGQLDSNQRVQASKACALPLGDSPSISLLARVGNGIRIHDLQNHNLAR